MIGVPLPRTSRAATGSIQQVPLRALAPGGRCRRDGGRAAHRDDRRDPVAQIAVRAQQERGVGHRSQRENGHLPVRRTRCRGAASRRRRRSARARRCRQLEAEQLVGSARAIPAGTRWRPRAASGRPQPTGMSPRPTEAREGPRVARGRRTVGDAGARDRHRAHIDVAAAEEIEERQHVVGAHVGVDDDGRRGGPRAVVSYVRAAAARGEDRADRENERDEAAFPPRAHAPSLSERAPPAHRGKRRSAHGRLRTRRPMLRP